MVVGLFSLINGAAMATNTFIPGYSSNTFTLDFPDTDEAEVTPPVFLQGTVTPGFVVLLENNSNICDVTTWSDVLAFTQLRTGQTYVQLFSDSPENTLPSDVTSLALQYKDSTSGIAPTQFIMEVAPPTIYKAGCATYRIYSDMPEIPEVHSTVLALMGAAPVFGYALRRRKSRV